MKHTPRPWEVDTSHGYPWHVRYDDGLDTVCRIGGHALSITDEETNEANARLIAASPDLLEALLNLQQCPLVKDGVNGQMMYLVSQMTVNIIDTAIAEATMREKQGVKNAES